MLLWSMRSLKLLWLQTPCYTYHIYVQNFHCAVSHVASSWKCLRISFHRRHIYNSLCLKHFLWARVCRTFSRVGWARSCWRSTCHIDCTDGSACKGSKLTIFGLILVFTMIQPTCQDNKKSSLTICPGSSYPFYMVSYYIKWVTTSSTHSILRLVDYWYPFFQFHQNLFFKSNIRILHIAFVILCVLEVVTHFM